MQKDLTVKNPGYVIVTPARNEAHVIENTIRSVIAQRVRPNKWAIVSDGSTDRTDEIVQEYCAQHDFIQLIRSSGDAQRNFGSKVAAFNAGYQALAGQDYEFIGNLDADVSFEADYFENLLQRFALDPGLGLGGGIILELVDKEFVAQSISPNSVAGAVQLFRRQCFEAIKGYPPLRGGGIDAAAEIMARQHGWAVQTFPDLGVRHHRRVAVGSGSTISTRFRQGMNCYRLGYHPLFALVTSMYRLSLQPLLLGGLLHGIGYCWGYLSAEAIQLPQETVDFLRSEQLERLKNALTAPWAAKPIRKQQARRSAS